MEKQCAEKYKDDKSRFLWNTEYGVREQKTPGTHRCGSPIFVKLALQEQSCPGFDDVLNENAK